MPYKTDKELRLSYYEEKLRQFKLNDERVALLPIPSEPLFKGERKRDLFEKTFNPLYPAVKQIKKNGDEQGFVWHTTREKLYEAQSWGIGRAPESVIGKVVWELGKYKAEAHDRLLGGVINFSFQLKVQLVQHYQNRFRLLEPLECLVNYPASILKDKALDELKAKILSMLEVYKIQLENQRDNLSTEFVGETDIEAFSKGALKRMRGDIQADIERANAFKNKIQQAPLDHIKAFLRATGNDSILQFVRRQMIANIDRGEKFNQDISFSANRRFALTRGYQKNCWVEAADAVEGYKPDLRNSPTSAHHGLFGKPEDEVAIDSAELNLSPDEERRTLGSIAFIEKYVRLSKDENKQPILISKGYEQTPLKLETIYSPNWHIGLTWREFFKKSLTLVKNFFVSAVWWTRPYEGGVSNAGRDLQKLARSNDPFWHKTWKGIEALWFNFRDIFQSLYDFIFNNIFAEMPSHIKNDFLSSHPPTDENGKKIKESDILRNALKEIKKIQEDERRRLTRILKNEFGIFLEKEEAEEREKARALAECEFVVTAETVDESTLPEFKVQANAAYVLNDNQLFYLNKAENIYKKIECSEPLIQNLKELYKNPHQKLNAEDLLKIAVATGHLHLFPKKRYFPHADYHLTAGEQNDLLTALARGGADFVAYLSKNLFLKDPVAGTAYTATYLASLLVVLMPALAAELGPVGAFLQALSKSWGSNEWSGGIAVASTVAPTAASTVNAAMHGPKSWLAQAIESICADPASAAAKLIAGWGFGKLLANGINGYDLGAFSKMLREDLGENPDVGYIFITVKMYLLIKESLHRDENDPFKSMSLALDEKLLEDESLKHNKEIRQFRLIAWLSRHQADIPKLSPSMLYNLERIIRKLFPEHADSLCRILYPEEQRSIAYQCFAIPLAYVSALIRCVFSYFSSAYAWVMEYKDWDKPIINAHTALFKQAGRDLTRLIVFAHELVRGVYTFVKTPFVILADIFTMVVGRTTALFGVSSGHAFGIAASYVALAVDWVSQLEFLRLGRLLKSVQIAHPNHTVRFIESTYEPILRKLELHADISMRGKKALESRLSPRSNRTSGSYSGSNFFISKGSESPLGDSVKTNSMENSMTGSYSAGGSSMSNSLNAESSSGSEKETPREKRNTNSVEGSPREDGVTATLAFKPLS